MSIIMTGGGTGGHLAIIQAVKEKINKRELVYIGSLQGQDRLWFEADTDFRYRYFLATRGVVNQNYLGKVKSLAMMGLATLKSVWLLRKHRATVVFCVGGFSAAPTAYAAKLLHIPLVIHEQNATMGSLNKRLKPYAKHFICSYTKDSPIKAYPVKSIFFEKAHIRSAVHTVLFLGGSQGAKAINTLALRLAPALHLRGIKIIHQAGQKHIDKVSKVYKSLGIDAEVFGFTSDLVGYMERSDFAIARAGASTLWELSANGLPALFIPYPYAASDHQSHNASFLVEQNLAWMMQEDTIETKKILELLDTNLSNTSKKLANSINKEGSQEIAILLSQM